MAEEATPGGADDVDLDAVEAAVQRALDRGGADGLRVLGHGEISLVVGWPTDGPTTACKRLPPFPSPEGAVPYREIFDRYLELLAARGVTPVSSTFHTVRAPDGSTVGYVTQPVVPPATIGPEVMRAAAPDPDHPLLTGVVDAVVAVTDARTGLDGQVSNWVLDDDGLRYLDVTTPMLFDRHGRLELDVGLFLAAYPWAMRPLIGRFVAPGVVGAYRDARHVLVDLTANLVKERLVPWIPAALEAVNRAVSPEVTQDEVRGYYRSDARLWEVMLRLRRADRWWQRRVRGRRYPMLLPGRIER